LEEFKSNPFVLVVDKFQTFLCNIDFSHTTNVTNKLQRGLVLNDF